MPPPYRQPITHARRNGSGYFFSPLTSLEQILLIIAITWVIPRVVESTEGIERNHVLKRSKTAMLPLLPVVRKTAKILIATFASLAVFDSIGVKIIALLAGLGIGRTVVALAAQKTWRTLSAASCSTPTSRCRWPQEWRAGGSGMRHSFPQGKSPTSTTRWHTERTARPQVREPDGDGPAMDSPSILRDDEPRGEDPRPLISAVQTAIAIFLP
jgi:hypothetical protein